MTIVELHRHRCQRFGHGPNANGHSQLLQWRDQTATLNLVSGSATYTNSTLAVGTYSLTATYNGTSDFTTSASDPTTPILQTINPDSTTTTSPQPRVT